MSWTALKFLDEMQARIEEEIPGVTVYTAPVDKLGATNNVVFTGITGDQEWAALGGGAKNDVYTVETSIFCTRSGSGDKRAKEVRDKAQEIVESITGMLRSLITGDGAPAFASAIGATQLRSLGVSRLNVAQGIQDGARWCQVDLDISVTASI